MRVCDTRVTKGRGGWTDGRMDYRHVLYSSTIGLCVLTQVRLR